jgi:hypothetical protein
MVRELPITETLTWRELLLLDCEIQNDRSFAPFPHCFQLSRCSGHCRGTMACSFVAFRFPIRHGRSTCFVFATCDLAVLVHRFARLPVVLAIANDNRSSCDTPVAVEHINNYANTLVTYCFEVTNIGATVLSNATIVNPLLSFSSSAIGTLQPSESRIVAFTTKLGRMFLVNIATASGNPLYPNSQHRTILP